MQIIQVVSHVDFMMIAYILAGCVIVLIAWVGFLHVKIKKLLAGSDAKSLEDTIVHAHKEITELRDFEKECLSYFTDVERRLGRTVQAVETVRFNPFKGVGEGGNQSFSTALISERGDGVVISSLYSRDHVGIFSKPLAKFQSQYELTEEEKVVINEAKQKLSQGKKN